MKVEKTPIRDAWLVELAPHLDDRGVFVEMFVQRRLEAQGVRFDAKMANLSTNDRAGTLRGMHWQAEPFAQAKIVYAAAGKFFDAIVDMRDDSATFGQSFWVELVPQMNALYVPPGVAHGCQALEDDSRLLYLVDGVYKPSHERGIRYDDPDAGIPWPKPAGTVSSRDLGWPTIAWHRAEAAVDRKRRTSKGVCICDRDVDGRCQKCIEEASAYVAEIVGVLVQSQRSLEAKVTRHPHICDACSKENADYILAKFARGFTDPEGGVIQAGDEKYLPIVLNTLQGMKEENEEIRHWPLLEKAVQDIKGRMARGF